MSIHRLHRPKPVTEHNDNRSRSGPGWRAARRFGEWSREHAFTQAELAAQLQVAQPTVSRWLRGVAPLQAKHYARMAKLMATTVVILIDAEDLYMWSARENDIVIALHALRETERAPIMELLEMQIEQIVRKRKLQAEQAGKDRSSGHKAS